MAEHREPRFNRPQHLRGEESVEFTARQIQVMDLLASGLQYKEIAHTLGVHIDTLKTHIRIIYLKLGVHSAAQATAAWQERKAHDAAQEAQRTERTVGVKRHQRAQLRAIAEETGQSEAEIATAALANGLRCGQHDTVSQDAVDAADVAIEEEDSEGR